MRFICGEVLVAVVFGMSPVAAQPPGASACSVTVARAPADVGEVVEAYVAAEPRCKVALDVWIVPTEGGYYVLARDEQGGIRERIVPSAQSAGVIVASWAGYDSPPPVRAVPPAQNDRAATSVATPDATTNATPDATTNATPLATTNDQETSPAPGWAIAQTRQSPHNVSKWLTVGGLLAMRDGGGGGLRVEVDVKSWSTWALGLAGSYSEAFTMLEQGDVRTRDGKAMAYLSRTFQDGRWQVRAALGAGIVFSSADALLLDEYSNYKRYAAGGRLPTAEGQVALARELGQSWAVSAGPLVTMYAQTFRTMDDGPPWGPSIGYLARRDIEVMLHAGLRYRM